MSERVFVYGTLMHEQPNHRVLVELGARRVGAARTLAPRTLIDLGPYPALLPADVSLHDATPCRVEGELYAIDATNMSALDAFEGCPDLYRRERIAVEQDGPEPGAEAEAWTYVLARTPPRDAVHVTTGRYAGGGIVLRVDAREADTLDKSAKISDVSPPRTREPR